MTHVRFSKRIIKCIKNSNLLSFLAKNIFYGLLRLLFATYRLRVTSDIPVVEPFNKSKGVFYFWHQQIVSGMFFFFTMKAKGHCVVSPSNDGKFVGHVVQKLGFTPLYGSPNKNPILLTRQSLQVLAKEQRLCLVGDGSRGPAFMLQKGVSYLAEKSKLPLFYVKCTPSRALTFKKSWDQFQIPLPFSAIFVHIHGPITRQE